MKMVKSYFLILFVSNCIFLNQVYPQARQIDTTFGNNGIVLTPINIIGHSRITSSALQIDGKIVAAGFAGYHGENDFAVARFNPDGTNDYSFGIGGIVLTDLGGRFDYIRAVAIQPDGKIVAAGCTNMENDCALVRYMPDGSLDKSFGLYGIVTTDVGGEHQSFNAMAIQKDSKIVAAGYTWNGTQDGFCLARYNPDGTLDSTFSSDGILVTLSETSDDRINSIIIQPDGKIIAGGVSNFYGTEDFVLVRYDSTGNLDNTFNGTGIVISTLSSEDEINSILLQNDGKIIAAGSTDYYGTNDFAAVRYNANGSVDNAFGINGVAIIKSGSSEDIAKSASFQMVESIEDKILLTGMSDYGGTKDFAVIRLNLNGTIDNSFGINGIVLDDIGTLDDEANTIILDSDGKIICAGGTFKGTQEEFALARYTKDGENDISFGENGFVTIPVGKGDNEIESIAIQSDGKIIAAGFTLNEDDYDFALARYNTDGSLDNNFGVGGVVTTSFGSGTNDYGSSVAIQKDGKIIIAGSTRIESAAAVALVRYNPDGSLDSTFDEDGIVTTTSGSASLFCHSVIIQDDGRIIAAGESYATNADFALIRYNENGSLDNTFGTDGIVITPIGIYHECVQSLVLQGDGKIIAAGYTQMGAEPDIDFAIARYKLNGEPDSSFGNNGIAVTRISTQFDKAFSVTVQAGEGGAEKILAAGISSPNTGDDGYFTLVRYKSDGIIDTSFGTDGMVKTVIGEISSARSLSIQSDGKIIAAGEGRYKFALIRYNSDGSPDNTFGTDGLVSTSIGVSANCASACAIQSDGKIIIAGYSIDNPYDGHYSVFTLIRYLGDIETGIKEEVKEIPSSFILDQNYPNPFNPTTTISYSIPTSEFVTLKVYEVLGREVANLINEEKPAGSYKVNFSGGNLSSGVYFYTLKAGKFSETKKLILMK